jgi:glutamate formiminotransferase
VTHRLHRPLLLAVPNVSEGRDRAVLAELAARIAAVPGAYLLDASSDPDHHRSVFTLAGGPEALTTALLALYEAALQRVDLRRHEGVHPRVGAVDVTPFVPLAGTSMATAVATAAHLGEEVARRFSLPVLLYEEAAQSTGRRSLSALRRGGLEALGRRLAEPNGAPDYGPRRLHLTAGATIIGARQPLIAVNVFLATTDPAVARAVARAVRESSGGLPAVRALGLALASRDRAQVSMNLVDRRRTSLGRLLAAVRREAEAHGVTVEATEIIGLVPEEALAEAAAELRPSPEAFRDRALEPRLAAAGLLPDADTGPGA